jgi:hypothetical protein
MRNGNLLHLFGNNFPGRAKREYDHVAPWQPWCRCGFDIAQGALRRTMHRRPMAPFLYRCPNTGFRVQGWSPDDDSKEDDVYESVSCLACGQLHLVNLRTGKTLGLHGD